MNVSIGGIAKTVEITSFDKLGDVKVCMLTTTADGSVGFEQLNDEVRDTIYASFPVDTAEGDIASFEDGADNVPVRELKLNLEPIQNLNGYGSPWIGGAGVNKADWANSSTGIGTSITKTATGFDMSPMSGGQQPQVPMILFPWSDADTAITVSFDAWATVASAVLKFDGQPDSVHTSGTGFGDKTITLTTTRTRYSYSGAIVAGTTGFRWFRLNSDTGATTATIHVENIQLEFGSTATSWTPYENICPIYPNNGKNLFSGTLVNGQIGSNGGYTSSTSRLTNVTASNVLGDFLKAGTYTISAQAVTSATSLTQCTVLTKDSSLNIIDNFAASWHDLPFTFTLSSDGYICFTLRPSTGNVTPSNYVAQVEHGSIATTYVPYNAIGITRTGKNLYDKDNGLFGLWENGGKVYSSTNAYSAIVHCLPNTTYSVSKIATSRFRISSVSQYPKDGVSGTSLNANDSATKLQVTTGNDARYLLIYCYYAPSDSSIGMANVINSLQVEVGSAATSYEPYQGERYYPISDNPVYGGTLEVETGVLTVTHGVKIYDGTENWSTEYTYNFYSGTGRGNGSQQTDYQCSHWKYTNILGNSTDTSKMPSAYISASGNFNVQRADISHTGADMKQWCLNQYQNGTPLTVVFRLNTPQIYQLTPVQVKTLLGYNNIWTDSGTVEVQYRANIGLYIQKIIGSSEEDMVANQNIQANKYFFVGEELYYSTSAISAGQTIIVGTNCIKTNLADALNALNS